jgi:hypothetical protein
LNTPFIGSLIKCNTVPGVPPPNIAEFIGRLIPLISS